MVCFSGVGGGVAADGELFMYVTRGLRMNTTELSPMMRQYFRIKENNKDAILFFRVGDFYEMFYDDAKTASEELDLALTGKDCGTNERAPMCGVPYHSCEAYIGRLIEKGYKVAICEQTEDPAEAKGLVRRDVIRIITPGTVIEDSMLDASRNNFLACILRTTDAFGVGFVDSSTGEFDVTAFKGTDNFSAVLSELSRFSPTEVIVPEGMLTVVEEEKIKVRLACCLTVLSDDMFKESNIDELFNRHFGEGATAGLGLLPASAEKLTAGGLLGYLYETQKTGLEHISSINVYSENQYMGIDIAAMRNLELFSSMRTNDKKGSLLWVLDRTRTAMGKRLLRRWIEQPLMSVADITSRLNAVDELYGTPTLRSQVRESLAGIRDIERLMTRIVYGTAGGRELRELFTALDRVPGVKSLLGKTSAAQLKGCAYSLDELRDVCKLIDTVICEAPPVSVREGGIIREGYSEELDRLRSDMKDGKSIIATVEEKERERTGIKTLKVKYNKLFGYYIEVTKSFLDKVPEDYIRKQTLTNCERYITDELKDLEARVLGAKERSAQLEYRIFEETRIKVANEYPRIKKTADALGVVDVICSLADVAAENNYCRPAINCDGRISISAGRHPVVEAISNAPFVPNDTLLDEGENRCAVITGPNMAGKSTYMRQVALAVIMTQIGSFVPARSADICICDAVFTRIGASDDITTGQSTFMVEMNEVAEIVKNATKDSLLILDEIGRGTSTYDGMAIARSVVEYVSDTKKLGAKTMFATHYHELTALEGQLDGIKNYNIAVRKKGDDITFLRRIVRGGADDSYGIEVAKLSGIPDVIITRAKQVLHQLEEDGKASAPIIKRESVQMPLTLSDDGEQLLREIKNIDVNTLTPIECMTMLNDLCRKAKDV